VVVSDLDVEGIPARPPEAEAPLVVDSKAVLSCPATAQLLEAVPWRRSEIGERLGRIKDHELAHGDSLDGRTEPGRSHALEDSLGLSVAEAPDHAESITLGVIIVKRYA
jgi:hypothetical protein